MADGCDFIFLLIETQIHYNLNCNVSHGWSKRNITLRHFDIQLSSRIYDAYCREYPICNNIRHLDRNEIEYAISRFHPQA